MDTLFITPVTKSHDPPSKAPARLLVGVKHFRAQGVRLGCCMSCIWNYILGLSLGCCSKFELSYSLSLYLPPSLSLTLSDSLCLSLSLSRVLNLVIALCTYFKSFQVSAPRNSHCICACRHAPSHTQTQITQIPTINACIPAYCMETSKDACEPSCIPAQITHAYLSIYI